MVFRCSLKHWFFCLCLLLLLSCNATFEGHVKLKQPDQKIPLMDKNHKRVYLDEGPNELLVRGDSIRFFVDGVRTDFILPPGMKWESNFYFMARQIEQPVDVKGFSSMLESEPFEVVEKQSCDIPKDCETPSCRQYYWVKSTYKKISKKFILEFHHPLDSSTAKKQTLLGYFSGIKTQTTKRKIKEEKLSDCLLPSDVRFRDLASQHNKPLEEKRALEKNYPLKPVNKNIAPTKREPGGGEDDIF